MTDDTKNRLQALVKKVEHHEACLDSEDSADASDVLGFVQELAEILIEAEPSDEDKEVARQLGIRA